MLRKHSMPAESESVKESGDYEPSSSDEEEVDDVQFETLYDSDNCEEYVPEFSDEDETSSDPDMGKSVVISKPARKKQCASSRATSEPSTASAAADPTRRQQTRTAPEGGYMVNFAKDSLYGKRSFQWSTKPPARSSAHIASRNIMHDLSPGPSAAAKLADNPRSCLELFFDDECIDMVVKWTNVYIDSVAPRFKTPNPTCTKKTTREEVRALMGILIFTGAQRDNRLTTSEMWSATGSPIYRAAMSEGRFCHLLRCLRFDDPSTRESRRLDDKFTAVRDLWERFIDKCMEHYTPGGYITIDEQLLGFRGKCPFRMFIPSKPARYGLKLVMACDVDSKYMFSAIPYLGKSSKPPANMSLSHYFIKQLVQKYYHTNRNITTDDRFTSIPLAQDLLHNCGLTLVGTIRGNKPEIPPEMVDKSERDPYTSAFCYAKDMILVSFCKKSNHSNKKLIHLLSTLHEQPTIADNGKPEIITTYDKTKGGVDTFDRMCLRYSCSRKTKCWPLCIWYGLINAATINAWVIYSCNTAQQQNRRQFMKTLAEMLVKPWAQQRLSIPGIQRQLMAAITSVFGIDPHIRTAPELANVRIRRCSMCKSSKDRKTKKLCKLCHKHICPEHSVLICLNCQ